MFKDCTPCDLIRGRMVETAHAASCERQSMSAQKRKYGLLK